MESFAGLDLLASSVLVLDSAGRIGFANLAAQDLLNTSAKALMQLRLHDLFLNGQELQTLCDHARVSNFADQRQELLLHQFGHEPLPVQVTIAVLDNPAWPVLIELREIVQHVKRDREERILDQSQETKQLVRNLAHEIKNPLGGIRGAAQLLEMELPEHHVDELREYTQVIIKETDRLQSLVDRLLAPHRMPHNVSDVNIHEVCERVINLIASQQPHGLQIARDYDLSIPDFRGDVEQLIQAVLNVGLNAVQAMEHRIGQNDASLIFKTRIARQVTIAAVRYRLALELHVIDNGPGVDPEIADRIFFPLVSGRDGGTGLGLTIAQSVMQQHNGSLEVESRAGLTDFCMWIPLP